MLFGNSVKDDTENKKENISTHAAGQHCPPITIIAGQTYTHTHSYTLTNLTTTVVAIELFYQLL